MGMFQPLGGRRRWGRFSCNAEEALHFLKPLYPQFFFVCQQTTQSGCSPCENSPMQESYCNIITSYFNLSSNATAKNSLHTIH
eukprot:1141383-Pelagomonas_calceolata.AAC.2